MCKLPLKWKKVKCCARSPQMDYFTTERINLMSFNNCIARLVSHPHLAAASASCA